MHKEGHQGGQERLRDIVVGMADGLTVPFALAAGLSGAVSDTGLVITAGLAEITAGSIAMGLGGYLAGRTEQDHYASELARERDEIVKFPQTEKQEVADVLTAYGISDKLAWQVAEEMATKPQAWVDFMMRFELGLEEPATGRALQSGGLIAGAYIAGGLLPLAPYFFTHDVHTGLGISVVMTLLSLFVFGYFKARLTGQPALAGAVQVTLIGAMAAGAAYGIATLFN